MCDASDQANPSINQLIRILGIMTQLIQGYGVNGFSVLESVRSRGSLIQILYVLWYKFWIFMGKEFDFTCKIFVSVFSDVLTFTKKLNDCEETNEIRTNNHLV